MNKPKFKLGETVRIKKEPGYTGTIILIDVNPDPTDPEIKPRYLLDCHPSALQGYKWFYHKDGYGCNDIGPMVAANWFGEYHLERA